MKLLIDSVQNFRKMDNPSLVFMLSGKRKSGKDFLADYLKGENKMFLLDFLKIILKGRKILQAEILF